MLSVEGVSRGKGFWGCFGAFSLSARKIEKERPLLYESTTGMYPPVICRFAFARGYWGGQRKSIVTSNARVGGDWAPTVNR